MKYLSAKNIRLWLFVSLIILAPLSKYPSVALPAYNFTSFRIGLYQILAALFVLLCAIPTAKVLKRLFIQNKVAFVSLLILAVVAILGIFTAIYKARSALLIVSILFLIALVFTTWWYVGSELKKQNYQILLKAILIGGILFGVLGILQFFVGTFSNEGFGILCKNCASTTFGFPRINLFAAEPQFFANSLIPFFFISLASAYVKRTKLSYASLIFTHLAITLTFSRGACYSIILGFILFFVFVATAKKINYKNFLLIFGATILSGILGYGLLVASASYKYGKTPNIAYNTFVSSLDHLTLGVINIPEKSIQQTTTNSNNTTTAAFISPGLIKTSTNERLDSAKLAYQAWKSNPKTIVFGVGAGNLGPYVIRNISKDTPNNLTVYIYYILLTAELGLAGLFSFLLIYLSGIWEFTKKYRPDKNWLFYLGLAITMITFLAQYFFFGTYINTVYIWLWTGIVLGLASITSTKSDIIKSKTLTK